MKYSSICGESWDVNGETGLSWKERLPEIIEGYMISGIKTRPGYSGRLYQTTALDRRKECKGGEKSKQRMTVAFLFLRLGLKEKPVVIWKLENPLCL